MNFRKLTDKLILGAIPEAPEDDTLLRSLGVTDVINCIEEPANLRSKWTGNQCYLPQIDDGLPRNFSLFTKGLNFFNKSTGIVYVHCWEGKRRGPTMAYVILRANGMSEAKATSLALPPYDYLVSAEEFLNFQCA